MYRLKIIIGHLFFWLAVPLVISYSIWIFLYQNNVLIKTESASFLEMLMYKTNILSGVIIVLVGAFGFYTVYFIIAPSILQKAKSIHIVLLAFGLFLITFLILNVLGVFYPEIDWLSSYVAYPILILFSTLGALFRVWKYGRMKDMENATLKQMALETQLNLLKTQINPHFLFNTINNIDVLIENDSKKASDYLKKLGELLRFMLYRVNEVDRIPLSDEIEYLNKYIDLQKIRSVNPNFVNFNINGNKDSITIAPMIFIVFVENAFKHSGDKKKDNAIEIGLEISGKQLIFRIKNTINKTIRNIGQVQKESGIGLNAVKRRLDLVYKNQYSLNVRNNENYYETTLKIELA